MCKWMVKLIDIHKMASVSKLDFELNGKCKDLVVMGWAGGFIIIDLKNDIILCFMKTKRTAAFTHLEERWKLEDSSYQKIKVIGEKEDSDIFVSYKYS